MLAPAGSQRSIQASVRNREAIIRGCRTSTVELMRVTADFAIDERGATAIEYAIVAAGVGCAVAGAVWNVGGTVKTTFYDKLASLFP
jgi:pilus assembly protein Flp/PilA